MQLRRGLHGWAALCLALSLPLHVGLEHCAALAAHHTAHAYGHHHHHPHVHGPADSGHEESGTARPYHENQDGGDAPLEHTHTIEGQSGAPGTRQMTGFKAWALSPVPVCLDANAARMEARSEQARSLETAVPVLTRLRAPPQA